MFPDVGVLLAGVLEAKNELFHLCAEVEITGASPPTLEDLIRMIKEDVIGTVPLQSPVVVVDASGRKLHTAQIFPHHYPRALRAHHLSHNHFIRPRRSLSQERRRLEEISVVDALLDSLSVTGGYDGTMFFLRLELDVSKQFDASSLEDLLKQPLNLLRQVDFLKDLFPSPASDSDQDGDLPFNVEISVSASAHASVLFGFELAGTEFLDVFTFNTTDIASRTFVQFEDLSAKFLLDASVSGAVSLPGVADIGVENGTATLGFGLGIEETSERVYFSNVTNMALSVRNNASWQKGKKFLSSFYTPVFQILCPFLRLSASLIFAVGVLDFSLPLTFNIGAVSAGLGEAMALFDGFRPIVSITSKDLFGPQRPSFAIDFDIEVLVNNGENVIGKLLGDLTGGLGTIASGQGDSSGLKAGPLG